MQLEQCFGVNSKYLYPISVAQKKNTNTKSTNTTSGRRWHWDKDTKSKEDYACVTPDKLTTGKSKLKQIKLKLNQMNKNVKKEEILSETD